MSSPTVLSRPCGMNHLQMARSLHVFQVPGAHGLHSTRFTWMPVWRERGSGFLPKTNTHGNRLTERSANPVAYSPLEQFVIQLVSGQ